MQILQLPHEVYSIEEIKRIEDRFPKSDFVKEKLVFLQYVNHVHVFPRRNNRQED